jgi:hypothetical protein
VVNRDNVANRELAISAPVDPVDRPWRSDLFHIFGCAASSGGDRTTELPLNNPNYTICLQDAQSLRYTSQTHRFTISHSNNCQAFRAATRASAARPTPTARFLTPFQARLLSDDVRSAIDKAVASSPVVLFMKGTPETPQCGFSRASIQILGMQGVDPEKFTAFNVLEDQDLRQGTRRHTSRCVRSIRS